LHLLLDTELLYQSCYRSAFCICYVLNYCIRVSICLRSAVIRYRIIVLELVFVCLLQLLDTKLLNQNQYLSVLRRYLSNCIKVFFSAKLTNSALFAFIYQILQFCTTEHQYISCISKLTRQRVEKLFKFLFCLSLLESTDRTC